MTLVRRLSVEELRELFDYDPETGELRWKVISSPQSRIKAGDVTGSIKVSRQNAYRITHVGEIGYRTHMIAFALHYGRWPDYYIDHKNGNGLDNRISNLREATKIQNGQNRRKNMGSLTKSKGVHHIKNRNKPLVARIRLNTALIHLGQYENEHDAALAYDRAAILAFGQFAHTNFPAHESEHIILPERILNKIARLKQSSAR
ncbi:MAG: hypothetical protein USCAAHI_01213 [Beijerinckiaceae bacterium]|jgi:hypothetical protein|nr:MAG: hypothetical protein USCAAHI_01213 [Beijerinckiaceae bacterium]